MPRRNCNSDYRRRKPHWVVDKPMFLDIDIPSFIGRSSIKTTPEGIVKEFRESERKEEVKVEENPKKVDLLLALCGVIFIIGFFLGVFISRM